MATAFGADLTAAQDTARRLRSVRETMLSMGDAFAAIDPRTGSSKIDRALDDFYANASDNRARMDQVLGEVAGLFSLLASSIEALDQGLAGHAAGASAGAPRSSEGATRS